MKKAAQGLATGCWFGLRSDNSRTTSTYFEATIAEWIFPLRKIHPTSPRKRRRRRWFCSNGRVDAHSSAQDAEPAPNEVVAQAATPDEVPALAVALALAATAVLDETAASARDAPQAGLAV
jgi:hypothetical protein